MLCRLRVLRPFAFRPCAVVRRRSEVRLRPSHPRCLARNEAQRFFRTISAALRRCAALLRAGLGSCGAKSFAVLLKVRQALPLHRSWASDPQRRRWATSEGPRCRNRFLSAMMASLRKATGVRSTRDGSRKTRGLLLIVCAAAKQREIALGHR